MRGVPLPSFRSTRFGARGRLWAACLGLALGCAWSGMGVGAQESGLAPEEARKLFLAGYQSAEKAAAKGNWATAEVLLDSALKTLGELEHPRKEAARAQLKKARAQNAKRREGAAALMAGQDLLGKKRWAEAEAMFQKALELGADAEASLKGLKTTRKEGYRALMNGGLVKFRARKWASAERAFAQALHFKPGDLNAKVWLQRAHDSQQRKKPAPPKPVSPASPPKPKPLAVKPPPPSPPSPSPRPAPAPVRPLPRPVALDRGDWQVGPGSSCIWTGPRLFLEEGDMLYRHPLKGDFQLAVDIEARMDHRSDIRIDLRPEKKDRKRVPRLRGYGSKNGSGPYLLVGKKKAGRGGAQPPRRQIRLGFRRRGGRVEFFCNGKKVAETQAVPQGEVLYLWVCGKGILDRARVTGGR